MNTQQSKAVKNSHLEACLRKDVEYKKSAGFDKLEFITQAATSISLRKIDISTTFLSKKLKTPLMIAPMTGGAKLSESLNIMWAKAAEKFSLAMGVGSQRIAIEKKNAKKSFKIRKHAPSAFLFANIGAGQLCKGWSLRNTYEIIDMIEADALFIHLNALQEACKDADVDFLNICKKISELCKSLGTNNIPVFAREVGFGISKDAAARLIDAGVSGIDCGGAGGTSWSKVEALCSKSIRQKNIALKFAQWGIPTATSIKNIRSISKTLPLIATGGLRSGVDIAKSIALGADIASMARPFLLAAMVSEENLHNFIEDTLQELRISMFAIGAKNLSHLNQSLLATS